MSFGSRFRHTGASLLRTGGSNTTVVSRASCCRTSSARPKASHATLQVAPAASTVAPRMPCQARFVWTHGRQNFGGCRRTSTVKHVKPLPRAGSVRMLQTLQASWLLWRPFHQHCRHRYHTTGLSLEDAAPKVSSDTSSVTQQQAETIKITDAAAARIRALNAKKGGDSVLRVMVESGGCSGFQYKFALESKDDIDEEQDRVFEHGGSWVVVDELSLGFMQNATLDFTQELIKNHFEIKDNPNTEAGCGCGVSFAPKL